MDRADASCNLIRASNVRLKYHTSEGSRGQMKNNIRVISLAFRAVVLLALPATPSFGDTLVLETTTLTDAHLIDANLFVAPLPDGQGDCVYTDPFAIAGVNCVAFPQIGNIPFPGLSAFPTGPFYESQNVCVPIPFPPFQVCGDFHAVARVYLKFDLSTIPDFVAIDQATLSFNVLSTGVVTDLYQADVVPIGAIVASEFETTASLLAANVTQSPGVVQLDVSSSIQTLYGANGTTTAFRLQLAGEGGTGDRQGGQIELSENNAGSPPRLMIEYTPLPQAFDVSETMLSVPEGATASFTIQMAVPPAVPLNVSVSAEPGDNDLTIQSGASLVFDGSNQPMTVTLAAAEDADYLTGTRRFRISAAGVADAVVDATESENDDPPARLYVDQSATGMNNGADWSNAFVEFSDALDLARSSSIVTEIWVAAGVYYPGDVGAARTSTFETIGDVDLYGGFAGTESALGDRDLSGHATILSGDIDRNDGVGFVGNSENAFHVVSHNAGECVLDGFVVQGGNADGLESIMEQNRGGAVILRGGTFRIRNCVLQESFGIEGGALHNSGTLDMQDTVIRKNLSTSRGGGVFNGSNTTSLFRRCKFVNNIVRDEPIVGGGGLYSTDFSDPVVIDCLFEANGATGGALGGGMYALNCSPLVINTRFIGNYTQNDGGAIVTFDDATSLNSINPRFINCTIAYNYAVSGGGGIVAAQVPNQNLFVNTTQLRNCIFWGNHDALGLDATAQIHDEAFGMITADYCCVQGGTTLGTGNISTNPLLTPDGHIRSGSAAIDMGDPAFIPDPLAPQDIDGDARIHAGRVDIGADEFVDSDGDRLPDWWESLYEQGAGDDLDLDTVTAIEEYEVFSSDPNRIPVYVDPVSGDDSNDGSSATAAGNGVGPKRTIAGGYAIARDGDTVLLAAGTYSGPGNIGITIDKAGILVRGAAAADQVIVDCAGQDRAVLLVPGSSPRNAFSRLTIRNGVGNSGGMVRLERSAFGKLHECVVEASALGSGDDGLFNTQGFAILDNVFLTNPSASPAVHRFARSGLELAGDVLIGDGACAVDNTLVSGAGDILLADQGLLEIRYGLEGREVFMRSNIFNNAPGDSGEIFIRAGGNMTVEDNAIIDLGGPAGGVLTVQGILVARENATIRNTNINVILLGLSESEIRNNNIVLLDQTGFGGEFFVEGNATIQDNIIVSEGDRYLDFDPDPDASQGLTLENNTLFVVIKQGVGFDQGTLLELRAEDFDCGGAANPTCVSGIHQSLNPQGYTAQNWVIEQLEILPGAKLNLTNRPGFVFQDPQIPNFETVYVKNLKLHPGAVLNTGLQTFYYQTIVDENDNPLGPPDSLGFFSNGAQTVDVPLLGFSLKIISMEDDTEFEVRVRRRTQDDPSLDPEEVSTPQGSVKLVSDPADPANGVMEMRTVVPGRPSVASVAAKGSFARAGEDQIVVAFQYNFCGDPTDELIVYLSDSPELGQDLVEIARIQPPMTGPGSLASSEFATFTGLFPRGSLNFRRGTYVELEIVGADACILIDEWDPLACGSPECGDYDLSYFISNVDLLYGLSAVGNEVGDNNICVDKVNRDNYVDMNDVILSDTLFGYGVSTSICMAGAGTSSFAGGGNGVSTPAGGLIIAGKSNLGGDLADRLYFVDSSTYLADPGIAPPVDAGHPDYGPRGHGRLIQDGDGLVYQLHSIYGLVRLHDGQLMLTPGDESFAGDTVRLGMPASGEGLPVFDVDFDPNDSTIMYVVPARIIPASGEADAYYAAAKLSLDEQAGSVTWTVLETFGFDPQTDPNNNTQPPQYSQTNVQYLRELEIDNAGNLFVSCARADNQNDWLLIYDVNGGTASEQRLRMSDLPTPLRGPAALHVSGSGGRLYIGTSLDDGDPMTTTIQEFTLGGTSGAITVTPNRVIEISNMRFATSIAEDAGGAIYIVGYTAPVLDPFTTRFFEGDSLFTTPTLAVLPPAGASVLATEITGADVALPISAIFNEPASACLIGDVDGSGAIDLSDMASFVSVLLQGTLDPDQACRADSNQDQSLDGRDVYGFVQSLTGG